MKLSKILILPLFILAANHALADNLSTNTPCHTFVPVTNDVHIVHPTISGEASAGGPYAIIGRDGTVDVTVSGSASVVTPGRHRVEISFSPSVCPVCGAKAPDTTVTYPDVYPDSYISDWTLTPGNGKGDGAQSFAGTNTVSSPGEYTLGANFKGFSQYCPDCSIRTRI
jgi:hypothetical protein